MINFAGTSNDADTQYKIIKEALSTGIHNVEFTKVDGTLRTMPCTLDKTKLPGEFQTDAPESKLYNPEIMAVWCTDAQGWRSFRTLNVNSITPTDG